MLAESVRTRGASLGFEPSRVVEQRDSGQTYFSVDLVRVAVPTAAEISAQTRTMLALAATCRVEYDGWGCMVVK
jgi:regulator of RNase E activity RraB